MKAPRYLGLIYLNGYGVAKDEKRAFAEFSKAAAQGDITGQYWLAYCYENGTGTAKNMIKRFIGIKNLPNAATKFPPLP